MKASEVQDEIIEWAWNGRLLFGGLCFLEGPPGIGKTTVLIDLAARWSAARPPPGGSSLAEPIHVLIVGNEDSLAQTTVPRLRAAGANLDFIHLVKDVTLTDGTPADLDVSSADALEQLDAAVDDLGVRVIIFDPIKEYLAVGDDNSEVHVRSALKRRREWAQRKNVLVVGVRHWGKGGDRSAQYRGIGSTAYNAVTRSLLICVPHVAEPGVLAVAVAKSNVAPNKDELSIGCRFLSDDGPGAIEWRHHRRERRRVGQRLLRCPSRSTAQSPNPQRNGTPSKPSSGASWPRVHAWSLR